MKRRLVLILGAGFLFRILYVVVQPRFDPTFARPILDGATYLESARALASGGTIAGVYYMPPLYPWMLSLFLRVCGEAWTVLFLTQQLAMTVAAGLLAMVTRKAAGTTAGLATACVVLLYHPLMFFASRPLGEALALTLLAAGLVCAAREGTPAAAGAGLAVGIASLARPNLLPLSAAWAAWNLGHKRVGRAAAMLAATLVALLPAIWHNFTASGHLVPVSANGGVVFWLGNAPGAVGVYTPAAGFTGSLETQQAEAVAESSARAGRSLDAVESDGFWWREGLRIRAADPIGSMVLLARRVMLTLDNAEHGLDYAPALDANPLRLAAPVPFAALLSLAVFGTASVGLARSGGFPVWSAVAIALLAPLLFYVSSRHRLPVAFLLSVPAGCGAAVLRTTRRPAPFVAGIVAMALSLAIPSAAAMREEKASALAAISDVQLKSGDLTAAADTARRATEIDPHNAIAWFDRGVIEAARGDRDAAERAYRAALGADATQPDAAANLAGLLIVSGRAAEAPPALEKALAAWPRHAAAWTNLVVAYVTAGDLERARGALKRAEASGVKLDPGLVKTVAGAEP